MICYKRLQSDRLFVRLPKSPLVRIWLWPSGNHVPGSGADDEQPLPLRRVLLQQHQDRLERQVGISGTEKTAFSGHLQYQLTPTG